MNLAKRIVQSGVLNKLGGAVDPDVFLEVVELYQRASESFPDAPELALKMATDNIHETLQQRGIPSAPYIIRARALPQLFMNEEVIMRYAPGHGPDNPPREINENLLRAAALARFSLRPKSFGYDIKDVLRLARELDDEADVAGIG